MVEIDRENERVTASWLGASGRYRITRVVTGDRLVWEVWRREESQEGTKSMYQWNLIGSGLKGWAGCCLFVREDGQKTRPPLMRGPLMWARIP